jgi:hypothetical protein
VDHELWKRAQAAAAEHPELQVGWVQGLAYNKAAPASVIRRIIGVRDRLAFPTLWLTQAELSAEVLADIATHPEGKVRRQVAENPGTDVETLAKLAADPEPGVRLVALAIPPDPADTSATS